MDVAGFVAGSLPPRELNIVDFVEHRASEICDLLNVVENKSLPTGEVSQRSRTYIQKLPRHLRRRAMTHNVKRIPRRLRILALSSLVQSKHRTKAPSRYYRRRPRNLRQDYLRRQRANRIWLATHIWHAKRFHMNDHYGYRLPERSTQRGHRASYRDAVRHCTVHDYSYIVCVQLDGPAEELLLTLKGLTNCSIGPGFGYKPVLGGHAVGYTIMIWKGITVGPVEYFWHPEMKASCGTSRKLWLWLHAAMLTEGLSALCDAFQLRPSEQPDTYSNAQITLLFLRHSLSRFRLTGPLSTSILGEVLQTPSSEELLQAARTCVDDFGSQWYVNHYKSKEQRDYLDAQHTFWRQHCGLSPACYLPRAVLPLVVKDPRLFNVPRKSLPAKAAILQRSITFDDLRAFGSNFLLDDAIRTACTTHKLPDHKLHEERSKLVLPDQDIPFTSRHSLVPVMLIQHPPCSSRDFVGFGAGWDLVLPAQWAMPFWLALQYHTAHAIGLKDVKTLALEIGAASFPEFWPDTVAGCNWMAVDEKRLKTINDKRPPNKRPKYLKLKVQFPFKFPWQQLVNEWAGANSSFEVLRDRKILRKLSLLFDGKLALCATECDQLRVAYSGAIVRVSVTAVGKGCPKPHGMLCLPHDTDSGEIEPLTMMFKRTDEVLQAARMTKARAAPGADFLGFADDGSSGDEVDMATLFEDSKEKKKEYRKEKAKRRKKEKRMKTKGLLAGYSSTINAGVEVDTKNSSVVDSCSRRIVGFVVHGNFSFSRARGFGLGFCSLVGLLELAQRTPHNELLFRNTTSKFYRRAGIRVLLTE